MKNFIMKETSVMKLILVFLSMMLICACSKMDESSMVASQDGALTLKSKVFSSEFPLQLSGLSHFDVYAVKEKREIADGDVMVLLLDATLTHKGGKNYVLETEESMLLPDGTIMLYRKICFDTKITPEGVVMFSWPETWWELGTVRGDVLGQLLDHTGCIPHGPGANKGTLNYKGYFDGTNIYAKTHFIGKQVNPEPEMEIYWNIDGPAKFEFSFTLEVQ